MAVNSGYALEMRLPPDEERIRGDIEEQRNRTPSQQPGDRYPIGGAFIGAVAGLLIGIKTGMPVWVILGVVGGGLAGLFIGSVVGDRIAKRRRSRNGDSDNGGV